MAHSHSRTHILFVLSTSSALALAWGCGGDEDSSSGGFSGTSGAQGSGTAGRGGGSLGGSGGSSGAATGGSSGASTGGSSGAATGGSSGAATGGSSGAPTDASSGDAGQCTGTPPLTDSGDRTCEVGSCRCLETDLCFPRAQAGRCCADRFECFTQDAGTLECEPERPEDDGSASPCPLGACYCSAPDACFPTRQAATCCSVAPVCN
jgi:hypothetical protein